MKLFRIVLSIFAFALAMGAAVASNDLSVGSNAFLTITNFGVTQNGSIVYPTVEINVCDRDLSGGIQCTVKVSPATTKAAYKTTAHASPLFR